MSTVILCSKTKLFQVKGAVKNQGQVLQQKLSQ